MLIEQVVFSIFNHSLHQFVLPSPSHDVGELTVYCNYLKEISHNVVQFYESVHHNITNLNSEKIQVYFKVIRSFDSDSRSDFFWNAPSGTENKFLMNLLLA